MWLMILVLVALSERGVFLRSNQGSALLTNLLWVPIQEGTLSVQLCVLWVPSLSESSVIGAKALASSLLNLFNLG